MDVPQTNFLGSALSCKEQFNVCSIYVQMLQVSKPKFCRHEGYAAVNSSYTCRCSAKRAAYTALTLICDLAKAVLTNIESSAHVNRVHA